MRKWVLGGCLCVASTSNNPCDEAVAAAKVIDVDAAQKHLAVARQHDLPCVADVGAWALRVAQAGQRAVVQGDARRAPPLLGAAWALAPIDESLTAKYITALGFADAPERTAKDALPDRAARVLDDAMARGVWRDPLQRPGEFDAALPSLGGWPEASPPVRACIADLERAYAENGAAFRAEALALLEARGYEAHEGLQDPAKPKWSYADVDDSTLEVSRPTIDRAVAACVESNQCVGCTRQFFTKSFLGDDAAVRAWSSGEKRAPPCYRAGIASMAWRSTRPLSTNAR